MHFAALAWERSERGVAAQVLWGECISGALYVEDFKRIARDVGFTDPRTLSSAPIEVTDAELKEVTGEARFWSITYRQAPSNARVTLCLRDAVSRVL